MKPNKGLLDRSFRYTDSAHTDIRRLFSRVRREMKLPETLPRAAVVPLLTKGKR